MHRNANLAWFATWQRYAAIAVVIAHCCCNLVDRCRERLEARMHSSSARTSAREEQGTFSRGHTVYVLSRILDIQANSGCERVVNV